MANEQRLIDANAVEVVHGRWEEWWPPKHMILTGEEMLYRCSSCTAKYADVSGYNYCPFCGAQMEHNYFFGCSYGERKDNERKADIFDMTYEVEDESKTNADRIRAMSDEELVAFIGNNSLCDRIQDESKWCDKQAVCDGCLVKWLRQPAGEE